MVKKKKKEKEKKKRKKKQGKEKEMVKFLFFSCETLVSSLSLLK
jgi:hypothetical protein